MRWEIPRELAGVKRTKDQKVGGSNPSGRATFLFWQSAFSHQLTPLPKEQNAGRPMNLVGGPTLRGRRGKLGSRALLDSDSRGL